MKHLLPPSLSHCTGFPLLLLCFPFLFVPQPIDRMEGLIGPLTNAQRVWLQKQHSTRTALNEIAGRDHWSDLQKANAVFDHFTAQADPILNAGQMAQEVAMLKILHPDWSLARVVFTAAWNVTKGQAHSMLDLAGLVPGLGEGADLANGVFYWLEGDKANAAFSFGAMVPFLGWTSTGAKYAGKIIKTATEGTTELKYVLNSSGFVTFGRSSQLAKVIGKKTNHQAHHIIPWSKNDHPLIQRAADSGDYHPNMALNGILLDKSVHAGYDQAHRTYNRIVEKALNNLFTAAGPNITPQTAAKQLQFLANRIRNQLSKGKKLDEIVL